MEAASFGQTDIVKCLLEVSDLELDAVNIRGQTAAEVAVNRFKYKFLSQLEKWIIKDI